MAPETPIRRVSCVEIFREFSTDAEALIGRRVWIEVEGRWLTITNASFITEDDGDEDVEEPYLSVEVSVSTNREDDLAIQQIASTRSRNFHSLSVERRDQYFEQLLGYDTYELIFKRDSFEIRNSCGEMVYDDFETPIEIM
jgi:hypothetical protein